MTTLALEMPGSSLPLRPYQSQALDAITAAYARGVDRQLVVLPTGAGKCHRAGQLLLMYDGSLRAVEDLRPGDQLMGPDSRPRTILATGTGTGPMMTIEPVKGDPWTVNDEHVLTLVETPARRAGRYPSERGGAVRDVSLPDWQQWSATRKHRHKLFRVPVSFPAREAPPLDPYFLGVLLGDGTLATAGRVSVTTADSEVVGMLHEAAARYGLRVRPEGIQYHLAYDIAGPSRARPKPTTRPGRADRPGPRGNANFIMDALRGLGLLPVRCEGRFIPDGFRLGRREVRLQLLAGLIDSDGALSHAGYDYGSKSERLARDTAFVARSLGLAAYVTKRTSGHYRVSISGDCSVIPCRIPRKVATARQQRKDVLRTGFQVIPTGTAETYYGFTLDGDGRYLLDDFTVTHNTVCFAHLVSRREGRSLILAHREELIQQAAQKLAMIGGSLDIGIVKARQDDCDARVVVASVPTLATPGRAERLGEFSTVIVDEAHHAVASTYLDVLERLGCMGTSGPLTAGFTATAGRSDKIGLGAVWQEITYQRGIVQMIAEGYLCDVRAVQIGTDFDLGNVRTAKGDFTDSSIEEELERSHALDAAVKAYRDYADGRLAVAFTPTIATAHALAAAFAAKGIPAGAVDGTMRTEDRRAVLARLHRGEIRVVANCAVLCLDDQTEILTDQGWTGIDEMTLGHRVANWDQGRAWFAEPSEVVRRSRGPEEDMYVLETPRRSVRVTGGHRMLYRTTKAGPFLKAPVEELAGRCVALPTTGSADPADVSPEQAVPLEPAHRKRLISRQAYHLRSREGYGWDESFTEAERRVERKYGLQRKHPAKLTLAECALIGFWLGDGSLNVLRRGGVEYTLSQAVVYPEIIRWVDATLAETGLHFVRRDHSHYPVPHVRWSLPRGTGGGSQQREGVYPIEPYLDKSGSLLLWGLDRDQFDALLTGLWYADGLHGQAAEGRPGSFAISSANREFLGHLQAIASVRDWTVSLTKCSEPRKAEHRQLWSALFTPRAEHRMGGTDPAWRIRREPALWRPERVWCVKTEAKNIITRRRGTVTVMGNTEGWDEPAVSCALMLRPTKSAPFFTQMVGRILRPFVGKEDALLLDVAGAADNGLATIADLAGLPPGSVKKGKSLLDAAEEQAEFEQQQVVVAARRTRQIELLRRSELRWLEAEGAWILPAGPDQVMILMPADGADGADEAWEVWRSEKGRALYLESGKPLALDWARGVGEEVARAQGGVLSRADAKWRERPPSEAQRSALERMGYADKLAGITRGGASDLMTVHYAAKNIRKLRKAAR